MKQNVSYCLELLLYLRLSVLENRNPDYECKQLFPLLIVGIMFIVSGSSMLYSNPKRAVEFSKSFNEDPIELVQAEKKRV